MLKRYLLWFCFPFVATAIICGICETFFELSFLLLAFIVPSLFFLLKMKAKLPAALLVAAIGFSLIWQSVYFASDYLPEELLSGEIPLNATVTSFSETTSTGDKITFRAKCFYDKKKINLIVYAREASDELKPGDRVSFIANVFEFENTESFAQKTYYKSRYADASANTTSVKLVSSQENAKWFYFPEYGAHYIKCMVEKLYSEKHAGVLNALILGDTGGMSDGFSNQLRRTGMSHAVSVSGMHISFIIGILLFFTKNKYVKLFAIPVMFAFAVLVGAPQSALRAAIMQTLLIMSDIKKREYDSFTSISFAAFVLVLANPYCAMDIAFLLSFAATLGIILLFPRIFRKLSEPGRRMQKPFRKLFNAFVSIISVSVAASLFTSPITAFGFNSVSLIAPLSNVLLGFPITVLFICGIVSILFGFIFFPIGKGVAILSGVVVDLIMNVVRFLSNFKYAEIFTGDISVILSITLLCVVLIYVILAGRKKIRPLFAVILVLGFLVGVWSVKSANHTENEYDGIRFDVLDVGQGQCIIATSGDECVVIDCGGEAADFLSSSHLITRGIPDIDALILTHAHADHANGADQLTNTITTRRIYLPASDKENATFAKLSENTDDKSRVVYVKEDTTLTLADMKISILTLPEGGGENENGLVVLVSDGEYELLITGDIPSKLEKTIVGKLPDCEAYVVGHHGSNTSSSQALLNKALPELCIISVGEDNSYGHPADETMYKLRKIGAEIKRTDTDGSITFYSRR